MRKGRREEGGGGVHLNPGVVSPYVGLQAALDHPANKGAS